MRLGATTRRFICLAAWFSSRPWSAIRWRGSTRGRGTTRRVPLRWMPPYDDRKHQQDACPASHCSLRVRVHVERYIYIHMYKHALYILTETLIYSERSSQERAITSRTRSRCASMERLKRPISVCADVIDKYRRSHRSLVLRHSRMGAASSDHVPE